MHVCASAHLLAPVTGPCVEVVYIGPDVRYAFPFTLEYGLCALLDLERYLTRREWDEKCLEVAGPIQDDFALVLVTLSCLYFDRPGGLRPMFG